MGYEVHYVGKALDFQHPGDLDGAGVADAADVVASEVQEHYVFGALLFAVFEFLLVGGILARGGAAGAGAGDGVGGGDAVLDFDHGFDGGADDLESVQVEVVHIGRRVDAAEGAVDLEGMGGGAAGKALGVYHLDDVAGVDVFNALFDGLGVGVYRVVGFYRVGGGWGWAAQFRGER